MSRYLILGAGLGLCLTAAAHAQTPAPTAATAAPAAAPSATTPPVADASATTSPYKVGATIKDHQGILIGTIARVIKTPDGATTISASVDGRNVNLPASALAVGADGNVVSSMSKAQISASTKPPA